MTTSTTTAIAAVTLLSLSLGGCVQNYNAESAVTPVHSAIMDQVRFESQRKIAGFPTLGPGMSETDVRRIMGERPVSPAPNTLEYTAYIHGDTDTIYIFTLLFEDGLLKNKSMRQIPPAPVAPRSDLFE